MELFKDRKAKLTLLSLLSAVIVISIAFTGVSMYALAANDNSQMTTFEEQTQKTTEDNSAATTTTSITNTAGTAKTTHTANMHTTTGSTKTASVSSLFAGMIICNVGTLDVTSNDNRQTTTSSADAFNSASHSTPKVSVKVMTETEIASHAANETKTATSSSGNITKTASSANNCIQLGLTGKHTNSAPRIHSSASMSNAATSSNNTKTSSSNTTSGPEKKVLLINGQDFVPRQVVLIFSGYNLIAIDEVDNSGNISIKVPMPNNSNTNTAGANSTDSTNIQLRFLESGTLRTGTFSFDGKMLKSSGSSDMIAQSNAQAPTTSTTTASSSNSTSSSNNTMTASSSSSSSTTTNK